MSDAIESDFLAAVDRVCAANGWTRNRDEVVVPTEDGRSQRVVLDAFQFEDEDLVRLASTIGPTEHIDPLHLNTALRLNFGLPHGALALHNEQLVLVDTVLEDEPDDEEIEAVLGYLAETADHFERTIFGTDEV